MENFWKKINSTIRQKLDGFHITISGGKAEFSKTREMEASENREMAGQAVLSLIFLIGGIIVLAGVTLAYLTTSFLNSTYGFQIGERARAAAASGVYDALLRLDRNKDLSTTGYAITIGSDSATVSVTQDSPSSGLVTVISSSTILSRQRRVRAVVSRDATSSRVTIVSWDQN